MRTVLASLLVSAALATAGCWPQYLVPGPPPPLPAEGPAPARPPVTADQVNTGNARAMAQTLWEEIDREQGKDRR